MLAGTASNYKSFFLIEHSDPLPGKVKEAHFDKAWIAGMELLAKKMKGKVLLIRNKKSDYKNCKIIYVDCIKNQYFTIASTIKEVSTINVEARITAPQTQWHSDPFFVVCTNGKKDKCCSKFGFPVFKFFENCPDGLPVWECTHVGGDRFAANAVCMPFGIYYGRIWVENVEDIISHTKDEKIFLPNYRGISRLSFFEQAVEYYLREHLNNYDINFPIKIFNKRQQDDLITVNVSTHSSGSFEIILKKEIIEYPHLLTCTSHHPENIVKYKAESIAAL